MSTLVEQISAVAQPVDYDVIGRGADCLVLGEHPRNWAVRRHIVTTMERGGFNGFKNYGLEAPHDPRIDAFNRGNFGILEGVSVAPHDAQEYMNLAAFYAGMNSKLLVALQGDSPQNKNREETMARNLIRCAQAGGVMAVMGLVSAGKYEGVDTAANIVAADVPITSVRMVGGVATIARSVIDLVARRVGLSNQLFMLSGRLPDDTVISEGFDYVVHVPQQEPLIKLY